MQLTGKHIVTATPATLWTMLMDANTLARIIPGISRLEKTNDNSFKSFLEIKMGPVNSSFSGDLLLEEITEQKGFTLKTQQNSKVGNANAVINITLLPVNDNQTEVAFTGDVKLSGILAGIGQRLIGGISNTLTKQFFFNLEKELEKEKVLKM
ncbi:MAG: carbon monoxide dehydrogenase subunit G [Ginsengibacter sp.]